MTRTNAARKEGSAMKRQMIPKKGMNPAMAMLARRHSEDTLLRASYKANMLLTLMVLHDKFGFGEAECNKFIDEHKMQLDAYNEGYVETVKDFEDVIKDELGIEINI